MKYVLLLGLALAAGCSRQPFYVGNTTDEAWRSIDDAIRLDEVTVGTAEAPVVTVPTEAGTLTVPARIEWTCGAVCSLHRGPARPAAARSPFDLLAALLEGTAHAHGPPLTGDAYLLELDGGSFHHDTIFTTDLFWDVDDETLADMRRAGNVTLTLTSAYFMTNRILDGDGPFRPSAPTTFTVE